VWCGDKVFIGPNAVICNDRWPSADKDGFDMEQFKNGLVTVFVHDRASIGAGAVILPGMTIGKDAMIAAGAVVNRSVPDGHLFGRDGNIVPIKDKWRRRRMFAA
jgi:acetyltransferase-like isoleucine patch superfamily enzyme